MKAPHGKIGDDWDKIHGDRNTPEIQEKLIDLCQSDFVAQMLEHTKICSVCRNLNIAVSQIIFEHIKEFGKI